MYDCYNSFQVQCFPVESILASVNNPTVNLFILDIEGFELAVLQAIDWNKVDIEVFFHTPGELKCI